MAGKAKKAGNRVHIKNWPESEGPRERLLEKGSDRMSDAALLAILLRAGRQGQNAVTLAREMIDRFGGLKLIKKGLMNDLLTGKMRAESERPLT